LVANQCSLVWLSAPHPPPTHRTMRGPQPKPYCTPTTATAHRKMSLISKVNQFKFCPVCRPKEPKRAVDRHLLVSRPTGADWPAKRPEHADDLPRDDGVVTWENSCRRLAVCPSRQSSRSRRRNLKPPWRPSSRRVTPSRPLYPRRSQGVSNSVLRYTKQPAAASLLRQDCCMWLYISRALT
jgi:hypothetical protein